MMRRMLPITALFCLLASPIHAQETESQPDTGRPAGFEELGTIRVHVRNASGAPLTVPAQVRLRHRNGNPDITETARPATGAIFRSLPPGEYLLEVTAPGYQTVKESALLQTGPGISQFFIHLTASAGARPAASASPPPLMAPKAAKQVQEAITALSSGDVDNAQKRLQAAEKAAPEHPEVQYLFGLLHQRRSDLAAARQRFEKAIELYPQHVGALTSLGRLLYQQGELNAAAGYLERALGADGRSADTHSLLASVFLDLQQFEKARYHAEQSLDIAAGRRPETRLLLAQILLAQGQQEQARSTLQKFLADYPAHQGSQTAQRMMARLDGSEEAGDLAWGLPKPAASAAASGSGRGRPGSRPQAALGFAPASAELDVEGPAQEWAPRDIDETPPAVFRDVPCVDSQVIELVGKRVASLAQGLGEVNATEEVLHTEIDGKGRPRRTQSRQYEYMFAIRRWQDRLWTEEVRNGLSGSDFIGEYGTSGLVAMALIFHPHFVGDFEVRCEGQGSWQGEPVWFLHFRHRSDRPARFYRFRSKQSAWLPLKGRAWVTANSYHIVRMEIGLAAPLPELRLQRMQWVIEYRPVEFKDHRLTYWLPSSAEIFADIRGKRWHRRHAMSQYVHFSVDTRQKIADVKLAESSEPEEPRKPPRF